MSGLSLEKNPNWNGGRTIASNGYVKIKMPDHPLSDVSGYVYEHRLIMEGMIGRNLRKGEIVHHLNGCRLDNRPENLELVSDIAHHKLLHRKNIGLRVPDENNDVVECACGCGGTFERYDSIGRPRRYLSGHNRRGKYSFNIDEVVSCACGCGTIINKYDKYGRERRFISGHNRNVRNKERGSGNDK